MLSVGDDTRCWASWQVVLGQNTGWGYRPDQGFMAEGVPRWANTLGFFKSRGMRQLHCSPSSAPGAACSPSIVHVPPQGPGGIIPIAEPAQGVSDGPLPCTPHPPHFRCLLSSASACCRPDARRDRRGFPLSAECCESCDAQLFPVAIFIDEPGCFRIPDPSE